MKNIDFNEVDRKLVFYPVIRSQGKNESAVITIPKNLIEKGFFKVGFQVKATIESCPQGAKP